MREIKFRGKRIDNDQWVYGIPYSFKPFLDLRADERYILIFNPEYGFEPQFNYLKNPEAFSHLKNTVWKVIPETVTQYTEQRDDDKKEIYEEDIIEFKPFFSERELRGNRGQISRVYWAGSGFYVKGTKAPVNLGSTIHRKILGNNFENPGLIKKKDC